MDLLENPLFPVVGGRVKTELFETASITALIYYILAHTHGSLGITRGHFACLLTFIEYQTSNIVVEYETSNVTVLSC